jgi:hypothetical protein
MSIYDLKKDLQFYNNDFNKILRDDRVSEKAIKIKFDSFLNCLNKYSISNSDLNDYIKELSIFLKNTIEGIEYNMFEKEELKHIACNVIKYCEIIEKIIIVIIQNFQVQKYI